jgi:hypothetical protein
VPHEIEFPRNIENVLASANEHGLYVISGWTIGIPRQIAIDYAKSINTDPNAGFFKHDGKVVLSHRDSKITLSQQEANAIVDLIQAAYGPF